MGMGVTVRNGEGSFLANQIVIQQEDQMATYCGVILVESNCSNDGARKIFFCIVTERLDHLSHTSTNSRSQNNVQPLATKVFLQLSDTT